MNSKNETNVMAILNQTLKKSAWKELSDSDEIYWNLEILLKYEDQLDWECISSNRSVNWTVEILEKFRHKIHWDALSNQLMNNDYKGLDIMLILEKFEDKLNWNHLSDGGNLLTLGMIKKYAYKWNWLHLLDAWEIRNFSVEDLLTFESYFPFHDMDKLCSTSFWQKMVEKKKLVLISKIVEKQDV